MRTCAPQGQRGWKPAAVLEISPAFSQCSIGREHYSTIKSDMIAMLDAAGLCECQFKGITGPLCAAAAANNAMPNISEAGLQLLTRISANTSTLRVEWLTLQDCVDASSKESVGKAHSVLIPATAAAANDAMPNIREAALQLLTSFAIKAGSMKAIDKVGS